MADTKFSPQDVKKIARLAKIELNPQEEQKLASQLGDILRYVSELQRVNTKDVKPTSQVTGLENVFRDDEIDVSRMLSQDQALSNAPDSYNGFVKVPAILEE